jgi:hypothetical protein
MQARHFRPLMSFRLLIRRSLVRVQVGEPIINHLGHSNVAFLLALLDAILDMSKMGCTRRCFIGVMIFLLSPTPAMADEWTTADTWRETAYLSLLTIDWAQTRSFLRAKPVTTVVNGCTTTTWDYEQNPILGKHPEQSHLDAAVIITGIAHVYIARLLPEKYRAPFQYISIGIEGGAVAHNFSLGVKAQF